MKPAHRCMVPLLLASIAFSAHASTLGKLDALAESFISNFEFLPEYHIDIDLSTFFLQKNAFFQQHYFFENNTGLEMGFLSVRNTVYSLWTFELFTGAGQLPGNTGFSLLDIDYSLIPTIETRLKPLYIDVGVEHRCFHEVDRSDFGLVHWNKLFCGVESPNARSYTYWKRLVEDSSWTMADRIAYSARWGVFMYSVFGMLDQMFLSRDNWKEHELTGDFRFALFKTPRTWMFNLRLKGMLGWWHEPGHEGFPYWRQDFIFESNFRRGRQGGLFFIEYILDDLPLYNGLPRFSKDRLMQVGVRFFI